MFLEVKKKCMMHTDPTNVIQKLQAADASYAQLGVIDCSNSHL
jgi:hypothetical protein